MWESVLSSLVVGGLSLIGVVYTSRKQHDTTLAQIEKQSAIQTEQFKSDIKVIQNDITNLEKKQDKHNSIIERMYAAEKAISVLEEKQAVANHRISDLEDDVK